MTATSNAWLFLAVAAVTLSTACGDGPSSLATAPSSARGAQVAGRVMGVSGLAATASVAELAASSLTMSSSTTGSLRVSVNGTNIETTTDGTGRFMLNGVPSGTIVLNFSGRGINADVTLRGVGEGDQIEIEVRLDGGRVRLESERRRRNGNNDDDDDDERSNGLVEVEGPVSNLIGSCPSLTFTIGMRPVTTSSSTVFEDIACSGVQNTIRVEVHGRSEANGLIAATRVERD